MRKSCEPLMTTSGAASESAMNGMMRVAVLLGLVYLGLLLSHNWWESEMTAHMGVLIPLLIIWGGGVSLLLHRSWPWLAESARRYRISLLLFALFTIMLWMLPRLLDASLYYRGMAILKWSTLPLAGLALVACWRYLPWLLRAVLHLEAIATLLRLGWLYMAAPQEYCVSYGIDDQQQLGHLLMVYAAVYGSVLGMRVMFVRNKNLD